MRNQKKQFFKVVGLRHQTNKNGEKYLKGKIRVSELLRIIAEYMEVTNETDLYIQVNRNTKKQPGEITPDYYLWVNPKYTK